MSDVPLPQWRRPHWRPGGGEPFLFYLVRGDFSTIPAVSRERFLTDGAPDGVEIHLTRAAANPARSRFGLDDVFSRRLRAEHPDVAIAIERAPHVLTIKGRVADTGDLNYLRDVVGLIMGMLDGGGVAVFDPLKFDWWTPSEWREQAFEIGGPAPEHHVVILVSDDEAGKKWVHTRGMLKFGRPDVSVRDVANDELPIVVELCSRFIHLQCYGGVIPEGKTVDMAALPGDWRCFHGGDHDDPEFNNVHVEVRRVARTANVSGP